MLTIKIVLIIVFILNSSMTGIKMFFVDTPYNYFLLAGLTLLISGTLMKRFIPLIRLFRLTDKPDLNRKIHTNQTPTMGGLVVFLSFGIGILINQIWHPLQGIEIILVGAVLSLLIGIKDDVSDLSARKRFFMQMAISVGVIIALGLNMESMFTIFSIQTLPLTAGYFISVFALMSTINAYNMIDGIDSLAGSLSICASLLFATGFYFLGSPEWTGFALLYAAAMGGFLMYNWPPAKIFMGDTGSVVAGYLIGIMALKFVIMSLDREAPELFQEVAPVLAMAVISVPLYDILRVFLLRIYRKQSPFSPDKIHIHHNLLEKGWKHHHISIALVAVTLVMVGLAILLAGFVSPTWNLLILIAFIFVLTNAERLLPKKTV